MHVSSTDEVDVDTTETTETAEKRVTWAELFFDLVYVFAVTEVSSLLHEHHGWAWLLRALIVFVPLYWSWVGTSILANTQDLDIGGTEQLGLERVLRDR